jgi:hypothetical protein
MRAVACLAASLALSCAAIPAAVSATVVLSSGPVTPLSTDLTARARWGGNNFEAVILNEGSAVGSTQLNPVGTPVWQLGQPHDFRMFWDWTAGVLTWQIDFNRNGSFGPGETASFTKAARAGFSYGFIRLDLTSQQNGSNGNAIDISNLSINGSSFGPFTESGGTPFFTQWFAPASGGPRLRSIEVLGQVTFRNIGGNGAFSQERPNLNLSLVGPEIVPEPASWAMLLAGFGLIGATLRRRRRVAA